MEKEVSYVIELINIKKTYREKEKKYAVLNGLNFTLKQGDMVAILGKSGSGKSTLLRILGLLELPDEGKYHWMDKDIIKEKKTWNRTRNEKIGFIMQDYALLKGLSVYDNIAAPMYIGKKSKREIRSRVLSVVENFQIYDLLEKKVCQLSGGEQQRVAIARAMVQKPQLLLADEPTGSLDDENAEKVMKTLHKLHEQGNSSIIVTHDKRIAKQCEKVYYLENGKLNQL